MPVFFRNKAGALKGPYSEVQLQEWYHQKWFNHDFKFYFMDSDKVPDPETVAFTLDELKERKENCCIFSSDTKCSRRLKNIEKEIDELDERISGIEVFERRMQSIDRTMESWEALEKLASARAKDASFSATERVGANPVAPAEKTSELERVANIVLEVLMNLENSDFKTIPQAAKKLEKAEKRLRNEADKKALLRVLTVKLQTRDFSYCASCDMLLQGYKHALLHLADPRPPPQHATVPGLQRFCVVFRLLLLDEVRNWMMAEMADVQLAISRYSGLTTVDPRWQPTLNTYSVLIEQFIRPLFDGAPINVPIATALRCVYPRLKKLAPAFMVVLGELLGNETTFCRPCSTVIGPPAAFVKHVCSYVHIQKTLGHKDPVTLFVNYALKKQE